MIAKYKPLVKNAPAEPKERAALPVEKRLAGEELLALQMFRCTPEVEVEEGADQNRVNLADAVRAGSFSLYKQFKPQDSADAILAALSVELKNATSDCLMLAARMRLKGFSPVGEEISF